MYDAEGTVASQMADFRARKFEGYTGYSENFGNAIGIMVDEDLSISSRMDPRRDIANPFTNPIEFTKNLFASHRTRKIAQMQKLLDSGKIKPEDKLAFTERKARSGNMTDWEGLAVKANEYLDADDKIETQADFEEIQKEELAHRRSIVEDSRSRSTGMGTLGSFAGSATAGAGLEPIAVSAAPLTITATGARELSRTMYALHVARNAALLNIGIQAPIEPFVHDWKEEIGAEYTWKDSVINLGAAGVLGGSVAGGGVAIGNMIGSAMGTRQAGFILSRDRDALFEGFTKYGFDEDEARVLSDEMYEVNNAPDPEANAEEFTVAREVRQEEMNKTDLPADPEPDELFDATKATPIKEEVKLTDDGEVIPTKGKVITKEDRMKALEAEEVDPLDAMLDELPDDLMFRIDGKNVKAKNLHRPIDKDLREVKRIQECLLGG